MTWRHIPDGNGCRIHPATISVTHTRNLLRIKAKENWLRQERISALFDGERLSLRDPLSGAKTTKRPNQEDQT